MSANIKSSHVSLLLKKNSKFSKVKKSKNMFMNVKKIEQLLKIKMPSSKSELNKTLKEFV